MFACLFLPANPASLFDAVVGGADERKPGGLRHRAPSDCGAGLPAFARGFGGASCVGDFPLELIAREFSPRVEVHRPELVTLDISGLGRLLGSPADIGHQLRRAAADRGEHPHIAIAATRTAAMLLALARAGVTVVPPGGERNALASLSLGVLRRLPESSRAPDPRPQTPEFVDLLRRWGLRTLGDLAALPARPLSERLGQDGVRWQRLARGEDLQPLAATVPEEPIEEALDLEWPVEGLEPLSFVLARLFDPLCDRLAGLDLGAVVMHLTFRLVSRETETRELQLPAPMRDPKALRTLVLLHLESHPLACGIDRVAIRVDAALARITQFSLLSRARPFPERMATLLARLSALLGERSVGAPGLVDSHRPGAFAMTPFPVTGQSLNRDIAKSRDRQTAQSSNGPVPLSPQSSLLSPVAPRVALRRFRLPVPARVTVQDGRPVRVATERRGIEGGEVQSLVGPWRTSGEWWRVTAGARASVSAGETAVAQRVEGACVEGASPERAPRRGSGRVEGASPERAPRRGSGRVEGWNRDEWDVSLGDGAIYRIYRDRSRDRWFMDGIVD